MEKELRNECKICRKEIKFLSPDIELCAHCYTHAKKEMELLQCKRVYCYRCRKESIGWRMHANWAKFVLNPFICDECYEEERRRLYK